MQSNPKKLSDLTDDELLKAEARKMKNTNIFNALAIGFLLGIIVYSVAKNTWGMVTLIPLYFVYRLVNGDKADEKELERVLKERGLK